MLFSKNWECNHAKSCKDCLLVAGIWFMDDASLPNNFPTNFVHLDHTLPISIPSFKDYCITDQQWDVFQRETHTVSDYFLLVIDTAEEGDNEIRTAVSIMVCRRSRMWMLKRLHPFSLNFHVHSAFWTWWWNVEAGTLCWPSLYSLFFYGDLVVSSITAIMNNPIDYNYLISLTYRGIKLMFR